MQHEDHCYRGLDHVLARAYVKLLCRWRAAGKRLWGGFLVPRYAMVRISVRTTYLDVGWTSAMTQGILT